MRTNPLTNALVLFCITVSLIPAAAAKPSGNVTYRPAPPATIRYPDGTVVTRHPDGSVDVSDGESYRQPTPTSYAPRARKPAKRKSSSAAKKHH